jgi:hypothetical protein
MPLSEAWHLITPPTPKIDGNHAPIASTPVDPCLGFAESGNGVSLKGSQRASRERP